MRFTLLRLCIKDKDFSSPHTLSDCDLVVDGDSFFKDTYRKSECQYILGPDCDKYAEFITNKLSIFLNSHVKCHFIFRGAIKSNIDKRKELHERIVYDQTVTKMSLVSHFQPLFVQDIQKQVLEEMDIKYFVCEYDSMEAIIGVAKKLKCPVLTDTLEYSLFGVSCIPTQSVLCVRGSKTLICTIYDNERAKNAFGVYNKTPMLLTLLNESGSYYEEVSELTDYKPGDFIWPVVKWVKRQREDTMVSKVLERIRGEEEKDEFKNVYERIRMLYEYPLCNLAVKYFQRNRVHGLYRDDKKWFAKGISDGRIAPAYIDLKEQGVVLGSTLMNDPKRPDALLAALEIVCYSHCLLTNSQSSTITFVGRRADKTVIQEIYSRWNKKIQQRDIFTKQRDGKRLKSVFTEFVEEVLPGSDFRNHLLFVPVDCWLLIITLVYYIVRKNKDFINAAYCILLSYIVLGPVSKEVDKLKKGESDLRLHDTDTMSFYDNLKCMFKKVDLHQRYDSSTVHSFSEFQHCLQYMNYLNKLCGKNIPCTVYHDTYNATFIYNTLMFMENKNHLMKYLKSKVAGSRWLDMYKKVVSGFENCLSAVEEFDKCNVESRVSIKMNYKVW